MPGSPYFDETPKGLLTWQIFSKLLLILAIATVVLGAYFDVLVHILMAIVAIGALRYVLSD